MPFGGNDFSRDRADRAQRDRDRGGNGGNLGERLGGDYGGGRRGGVSGRSAERNGGANNIYERGLIGRQYQPQAPIIQYVPQPVAPTPQLPIAAPNLNQQVIEEEEKPLLNFRSWIGY